MRAPTEGLEIDEAPLYCIVKDHAEPPLREPARDVEERSFGGDGRDAATRGAVSIEEGAGAVASDPVEADFGSEGRHDLDFVGLLAVLQPPVVSGRGV